jgi:hypothetical protein
VQAMKGRWLSAVVGCCLLLACQSRMVRAQAQVAKACEQEICFVSVLASCGGSCLDATSDLVRSGSGRRTSDVYIICWVGSYRL